jgi:hypothetical protein
MLPISVLLLLLCMILQGAVSYKYTRSRQFTLRRKFTFYSENDKISSSSSSTVASQEADMLGLIITAIDEGREQDLISAGYI